MSGMYVARVVGVLTFVLIVAVEKERACTLQRWASLDTEQRLP